MGSWGSFNYISDMVIFTCSMGWDRSTTLAQGKKRGQRKKKKKSEMLSYEPAHLSIWNDAKRNLTGARYLGGENRKVVLVDMEDLSFSKAGG